MTIRRSTVARFSVAAGLLAGVVLATPAAAWFTVGHAKVTRAAVRALPASMPAFFRDGAFTIGEAAVDPDLLKDRNLPALRAAEDPQHFIDWELWPGGPLPADRWAFAAAACERKVDPAHVGILPYSLLESVQRLTMTFAEHRRYPDNVGIQQKALVYAGWLAHYAGDLEQPLHTTIHHDGRALPDGSSPKSGIHQLVDALFERVPLDETVLLRSLPMQAFPDAWVTLQTELAKSHAMVDHVYELEPQLRAAWPPPPAMAAASPSPAAPAASPAMTHPGMAMPGMAMPPGGAPAAHPAMRQPPIPPAVVAFTAERYRATASFIASLYLTAWEQSAKIELPSWLERPPAPASGAPHASGRPTPSPSPHH